jgi:hypothetical protein
MEIGENIQIYINETVCEGVKCFNVAQNTVPCQDLTGSS